MMDLAKLKHFIQDSENALRLMEELREANEIPVTIMMCAAGKFIIYAARHLEIPPEKLKHQFDALLKDYEGALK